MVVSVAYMKGTADTVMWCYSGALGKSARLYFSVDDETREKVTIKNLDFTTVCQEIQNTTVNGKVEERSFTKIVLPVWLAQGNVVPASPLSSPRNKDLRRQAGLNKEVFSSSTRKARVSET